LELDHCSKSDIEALEKEIVQEVEEAANQAKESPFPAPEEVEKHVFAE